MKQLRHGLLLPFLCWVVMGMGASISEAQYSYPPNHPRLLITEATLPAVAERCKVGGSHRQYYDKLKEFADYVVSNNRTSSPYLPNAALIYKIHKYWNDTNYQGGGFEENAYWTHVRDALLGVGAWGSDASGAEQAMSADWIWEKLSSSDISGMASRYGTPSTSIFDGQTWRGGTAFWVVKSMYRSALFAGSSVDGGSYSNEYQAICNYIQTVYAPAFSLSGGVGVNGAAYATQNVDNRVYAFEGFTSSTGTNIWTTAHDWAFQYGKWIQWANPPHRGILEANQDYNTPIWGDNYMNVALMAWRGQDPYNQRHTNKQWSRIQSRNINDYKNVNLFLFTLFYDFNLQEVNLVAEPQVMRLSPGGMDHTYMSTNIDDKNGTWAYFESGRYFYGHQHQDAGSFSIGRKGDLVIDSGFYGQYRSTRGGSHASNYYHRSTAHNCVSVYDPGEKFYWGASSTSNGTVSNDGGQFMPQSAPSFATANSDSAYHPAKVVFHESNNEYTYIQGDLHNAYSYEVFADNRNLSFHPDKLSAITREFVFLRPNYFIVFDRVTSTNANFTKTWNIHMTGDPTIFGSGGVQRAGDSQAGIRDYAGASLARWTDENSNYNRGSIFLKTLMPKNRVMRKIGGRNREASGYAYWIGGFDGNGNYDPTFGKNYYWGEWTPGNEYNESFLQDRATPGWGRIEVEATTPQLHQNFLNVLYPVDETNNTFPETNLIETPQMAGAEIVNDRVILFGRTATTGIDSVTYQLAGHDTSALHMICNLDPGATYHIYRDGATVSIRKEGLPPGSGSELVTPAPSASSSGIIAFYDDGTAVGPPPENVVISNVAASPSGFQSFAVTITWTTNIPSDSKVEFGSTSSYGTSTGVDPSLVTTHSVTLLEPEVLNDQTYHFRVISDAPGTDATSSQDFSFKFDVPGVGDPTKIPDLREQ